VHQLDALNRRTQVGLDHLPDGGLPDAARTSYEKQHLRNYRNLLGLLADRHHPRHRLLLARNTGRLGVPAGPGRGFRSGFSKHPSSSQDLSPGPATRQKLQEARGGRELRAQRPCSPLMRMRTGMLNRWA
jgi:hypothetical protein